MFYQKLFLIQNFDFHSINGKIIWVSALLSNEMHYLSNGQGLTLSPMKKIRCSFKYFEQCMLLSIKRSQSSINLHIHENWVAFETELCTCNKEFNMSDGLFLYLCSTVKVLLG